MCLKRCVNKLADSGHIIVAAQNNNSFITYPATFTNVIGVSASHENQDILLNTEYVFLELICWENRNMKLICREIKL